MSDQRTIKKTKFFTVLAVTVLFVLVLLLTTLLIQISHLNSTVRGLEKAIAELKVLEEDAEKKLEARTQREYIEQRLRELGFIKEDERVLKGE